MEKLIDAYSKITPRNRYAAVAAIAITVLALFYLYVYQPHTATMEKLETEYRAVEAERAEKQAYVDNLARYEARLADSQRNLSTARAQLPDDADVPQLLAQLGNKARQAGLVIEKFEPKGEVTKDFYAEIGFAVAVTGSFHEVATFIDALGKLDRIINVRDLTMKSPQTQNQKVIVQSTFDVKTYRFLSEAEQKESKAAKTKAAGRKK